MLLSRTSSRESKGVPAGIAVCPKFLCDPYVQTLEDYAIFFGVQLRGFEARYLLEVVDRLEVAVVHPILHDGIGLGGRDLQYIGEFGRWAFVHVHLAEVLRKVIVDGLDLLVGGGCAAGDHVVDKVRPTLFRGATRRNEVRAMAGSTDLLDHVLSFAFGEVLGLSHLCAKQGDQCGNQNGNEQIQTLHNVSSILIYHPPATKIAGVTGGMTLYRIPRAEPSASATRWVR